MHLELTEQEAEWLLKLIKISRDLGRMWDMRLDDDLGNAVAVKVASAYVIGGENEITDSRPWSHA